MIRQRLNAGLTRAVEAGKQLGRPRIDPALEKRIQSQLPAGKGMLKFAVPAVERHCGNLLSDVVAPQYGRRLESTISLYGQGLL
jgi:hypothetical protein